MTKYAVKATVYLQIESEVDGVGDAQHEVENLIYLITDGASKVKIARATNIEILDGELVETAGISVDKLWLTKGLEEKLLDNGVR